MPGLDSTLALAESPRVVKSTQVILQKRCMTEHPPYIADISQRNEPQLTTVVCKTGYLQQQKVVITDF
jgi:hypothetical protein